MSKAILFRMASGIPGDVTRMQSSIVESLALDLSNAFPAYGLPGKIVSGKFTPIVANDVASSIFGFLVRPFPTSGTDAAGLLPNANTGFGNILRSGYMAVKNNAGTPALNGQVYVRVANPSGAKVIGGVEALAEYATPVAAPGANTGNGTVGTLTAVPPAVAGVTNVKFLTATTFSVIDSTGARLADGATGVAYSSKGLGFTITAGGTAFVAGDTFTITVVSNTVPVSFSTFKSAADAAGNVEIEFQIA